MENDINKPEVWFEIFENGNIWVLHRFNGYLFGKRTYFTVSDFLSENLRDNGIYDFSELGHMMGLIPVQVW